MHVPRVATRAVMLAAAGVVLAGCGVFGGDEGTTSDGGPAPKVELASDNHVKEAVAKSAQLWRGYDISVDVLSLKKYDKAVRLVYAVIPRAKGSTDPLSRYTFGSDSTTGHGGDAYLVDGERSRVYEHLTIGSGDKTSCACSSVGDDYPLDQPTVMYVDFPAPKDSSDKLTVVFPVVGPVPGVKIQ